jgi:hypothetical protein
VRTLQLVNGDLVAGPTGHATNSGAAKIRQELALGMGEEYGNDRFHPEMGSVLGDFIGTLPDEETMLLVRSEVSRILSQYIGIQQREVLRDHLAARASRFDASDVVTGVTSIDAVVELDVVRVKVSLVTQAGTTLTITRTVQP